MIKAVPARHARGTFLGGAGECTCWCRRNY